MKAGTTIMPAKWQGSKFGVMELLDFPLTPAIETDTFPIMAEIPITAPGEIIAIWVDCPIPGCLVSATRTRYVQNKDFWYVFDDSVQFKYIDQNQGAWTGVVVENNGKTITIMNGVTEDQNVDIRVAYRK